MYEKTYILHVRVLVGSGVREIGQESVRTVWPCFRPEHAPWRKEAKDADRIKGNEEQLNETETEDETVAKRASRIRTTSALNGRPGDFKKMRYKLKRKCSSIFLVKILRSEYVLEKECRRKKIYCFNLI